MAVITSENGFLNINTDILTERLVFEIRGGRWPTLEMIRLQTGSPD
jgi:hypothetical protein